MITLSSDFGSPYPAAMKGVILQRTDARLVDVAHDFPRQDVRSAAFWLREILPQFPPAVHLVVVDPGVGTDRAAIVVRAGDHALVGPDNGVLVPVARRLAEQADADPAGEQPFDVFEILEGDESASNAGDWPPSPASSTFHGRDVFAPAAARVHEIGADNLDGAVGFASRETVTDLSFPAPTINDDGASGEVLVVDGFGNVITNVPGEELRDSFGATVGVNGTHWPARETYARLDPGERLVTVGSHGNVELAVNQGSGEEAFGLSVGDTVELSW